MSSTTKASCKVNPYASNGFHAFLTSPQSALVGFMSDNGEIALSKPVAEVQPTTPSRFTSR